MLKTVFYYTAAILFFTACHHTENKEDTARFFQNYIADIPEIKLPQTYIVNQEKDDAFARPLDSVIAKRLDLEMSENLHEYGWEISVRLMEKAGSA